MADIDPQSLKKRKKSDLSSISELSVSELDTSSNSPKTKVKQKKKKSKGASGKLFKPQTESDNSEQVDRDTGSDTKMSIEMNKQLSEINKKLSNVVTRDDGFLRDLIRDIFQQMKDEFLKSVSHRIDILEGKLFEKDQENESLKREIHDLNKSLDYQKTENEKLVDQIQKVNEAAEEKINDLEQYGRRNNLRITGIPEQRDVEETAEMTTRIVLEKLNDSIETLDLERFEIDIAHRLGQKRANSHRPIIIKFQSKMKRDAVLRSRKVFKGSKIFVNEDLTRKNQLALACVRKKMPDEVDKVWTRNGHIFYKNKTNHIHEVKYKDYQDWFDLPWLKPEDDSVRG